MNNTEFSKKIFDHYGLDAQLGQLYEECVELCDATANYIDGKDSKKDKLLNDLVSEIADVKIMVTQIKYGLGLYNEVEALKDYKIARQHCPFCGGEALW